MLEKLKQKIQKRIEENSVKIPDVSYKKRIGRDKNGKPEYKIITEDIVLKRSLLPLGDWQRIYPILNEDGSLNIINLVFGGKKNFVKLLIILGIVGIFFIAYKEIAMAYSALREICEPYLIMRI